MVQSRWMRTAVVGAILASVTGIVPLGINSVDAIWAQTRPSSTQPSKQIAIPKNYASMKSMVDRTATTPMAGVALWQRFVELSEVTADDKTKGDAELQVWTQRDKDDAVLIKKIWMTGAEKDKIVKEVEGVVTEGGKMFRDGQALAAVDKLKNASKLWPENFDVQFLLGVIALQKNDEKEALFYFESCRRLRPQNVAVLNNLAVAYLIQKSPPWEKAITTLYEASKYGDTKELANTFRVAFRAAPEGLMRKLTLKPARDAMFLLSTKYGISDNGRLEFMRPEEAPGENSEKAAKERKGVIGFGSGFVISADGYILTNRHVAELGDSVLVKFADQHTQKTGEIVMIDTDQDLALIKVKSDKPLSYVKFAKSDNPADGAVAVIMGYPAPTMLGFNVKTTSGPVATGNNSAQTSDVTLDARVNPGNSGGPVYDQSGNVMAIIAQKTATMEAAHMDSYGLAISAGRVRKFLTKNNIKIETGDDEKSPLTVQQVSERNKMATVCLVAVKN